MLPKVTRYALHVYWCGGILYIMIPTERSRGSGLIALLVVIALLAFIFFGVQIGNKKSNVIESGSVIEIGVSGMERAAYIRDTVNEREQALQEELEL